MRAGCRSETVTQCSGRVKGPREQAFLVPSAVLALDVLRLPQPRRAALAAVLVAAGAVLVAAGAVLRAAGAVLRAAGAVLVAAGRDRAGLRRAADDHQVVAARPVVDDRGGLARGAAADDEGRPVVR